MSSLTEKYQPWFAPEVRTAGKELAAQGTRLWGSDDRISCEFPDGTTAELFLVKNHLTYRCGAENPKPYLWAVLVLAEQFQDLQKALQRNIAKKLFPQGNASDGGELRYERERPQQLRPRPVKQEPPPLPHITIQENNDIEILFVVRPDLQENLSSLPIETWWRSAIPNVEGKRPLKMFLLDRKSTRLNSSHNA